MNIHKERYSSSAMPCFLGLMIISISIAQSMQFPSTNDPSTQLLVPITTLATEYYQDGNKTTPRKATFWSNSSSSQFSAILNKNENGLQGYIKLDPSCYFLGAYSGTGPDVGSINQVLKFINIKCFASKIFLREPLKIEQNS